jgi:hypothetical protein
VAKKQLAKAALDRIKRSAKNGYPKKKTKPKFVVTSSKTVSEGKKSAPKAKTFKQTKAAKKYKPGFKTGVAAGAGTTYAAISKRLDYMKKAKAKEPTKRMADDAYKKQKEKQKKYYDKKTERKRK